VQRGSQRTLLYLQHFVGIQFNGLCNGVPVPRPQQQSTQNQQVQRALQQFDALALFFSRHPR